jgi:hypothetical protein
MEELRIITHQLQASRGICEAVQVFVVHVSRIEIECESKQCNCTCLLDEDNRAKLIGVVAIYCSLAKLGGFDGSAHDRFEISCASQQ